MYLSAKRLDRPNVICGQIESDLKPALFHGEISSKALRQAFLSCCVRFCTVLVLSVFMMYKRVTASANSLGSDGEWKMKSFREKVKLKISLHSVTLETVSLDYEMMALTLLSV